MSYFIVLGYRICQNKRPVRLIFRSKFFSKTHQSPSVLCTPLFGKSPIKAHRFCVLPPLENHCFGWVLVSGWAFISANTVSVLILVEKKIPFPILLQMYPCFLLFCILKGRSNLCLPPQRAVLPDTKVWPFLARNRRPAAAIFGRY